MNSFEGDEIICTQETNDCVKEIVKAILVLDHSKKPFKQADISKFLSKKPNRKTWEILMNEAEAKLKEMGFKLNKFFYSNSKYYILTYSAFPLPSMHTFAEDNETADRTLLILILTFIFMKQGEASNDDIINHLENLNIYMEDQPIHPYFGDIKKKLLNEYVSQLYLEKIMGTTPESFTMKWGKRALLEVSKRSILEFVCSVGYKNSIQPKALTSYYQEVLKEEEEMKINGSQEEPMVIDD